MIWGAMPVMMLGSIKANKTPGEQLEDAIKELKRLPAPPEKAEAAWAKKRDRVVTILRKVKVMVEPQTIEVTTA